MASAAPTFDPAEKLVSVELARLLHRRMGHRRTCRSACARQWIDGNKALSAAEPTRRGGWTPDIVDIMDPYAWNDPGHYEPHAKLKAMDRDGVFAEVIFPEVGGGEGLLAGDHGQRVAGDAVRLQRCDRRFRLGGYRAADVRLSAAAVDIRPRSRRWSGWRGAARAACNCLPFPTELGLKDYYHEDYHRLWGVIQETGLTILNHLDNSAKELTSISSATRRRSVRSRWACRALAACRDDLLLDPAGHDGEVPQAQGDVRRAGPRLAALPVRYDPRRPHHPGPLLSSPNLTMLPSEYFKRQMGATFIATSRSVSMNMLP